MTDPKDKLRVVGTSGSADYLRDKTANRRFWALPFDGEADSIFTVWPKDGIEEAASSHRAWSPKQAAELRAGDDDGDDVTWPIDYLVRDGRSGWLWEVRVDVVTQLAFVASDVREVPMPPATHVLWSGNVLCGDLRLRGVAADWPDGQCWISLKDVADEKDPPADRCGICWTKAVEAVVTLRPAGKKR